MRIHLKAPQSPQREHAKCVNPLWMIVRIYCDMWHTWTNLSAWIFPNLDDKLQRCLWKILLGLCPPHPSPSLPDPSRRLTAMSPVVFISLQPIVWQKVPLHGYQEDDTLRSSYVFTEERDECWSEVFFFLFFFSKRCFIMLVLKIFPDRMHCTVLPANAAIGHA